MVPVLLVSCGGGGGGGMAGVISSSARDITAFSFRDAANSALTQDVVGTISGTIITLNVPGGTAVTALVATFTTTGKTVSIGATVQTSGATANNFSSPVSYTVTAEDNSTRTYTVTVSVASGAMVASHQAAANFDSIPAGYINAAKSNLHIAYGHTSHGSQLITGMNALKNFASYGTKYKWNNGAMADALDVRDYAMGGDVGYYPDWVNNTRSYLGTVNASGRGSNHPEINVVIWSWCGQASTKTQQTMIDEYLAPMTQLENDYFGIKFVYMTGHLDGTGSTGDLNIRNQQIRNYCGANNKILFDFADIESYDPGGNEFMTLGANDGCYYNSGAQNWATEWISGHAGNILETLAQSSNCDECAHSQRLNCVLKGRAAWWLWARLAGWDGNP